MTRSLRFALLAPLTLMVAACNDGAEEAETTSLEGEAIAPIEAPEGTSWLNSTSTTEEGGFVIGNPDAPLKLVEYASHTCGACAQFATNGARPLQENYVSTGVVSFEIRPLLRDPVDVTISTLARCGTPDRFHALSDQAWEALPEFFENLQTNSAAYEAAVAAPIDQRFVQLADAAGLTEFFASRGLSEDQARTCLSDGAAIDALATKSGEVAQANNVSATPTFFLNGQRLDANQWPGIEPILQRAGAR